jgi:hypothetical protein
MPVTLEQRVAALEEEVAQIKAERSDTESPSVPWWEQMFGVFADSEGFDEATRLGREWRESFRLNEDEVSPQ